MTYDMVNTDKLNVFREELQRLGIALLPEERKRAEPDFGVEALDDGKPAIRYALAALKNVGANAMAAVVAERSAKGRFRSLADFAQRLDARRSEEHTSELQSLMRNSYDVFCLKKK